LCITGAPPVPSERLIVYRADNGNQGDIQTAIARQATTRIESGSDGESDRSPHEHMRLGKRVAATFEIFGFLLFELVFAEHERSRIASVRGVEFLPYDRSLLTAAADD
jgi:hypothetical protein